MTNLFRYSYGKVEFIEFPLRGVIIPNLSAFPTNCLLIYKKNAKKRVILVENDNFMHIDEGKANFIIDECKCTFYVCI